MTDYSDKTDEELLREYHLGGNPHFLNVLFSRYADIGFRTAMRYMRNSSDAEDVLQLAFIQFLQNLHFFREGASTVKPWLLKMIVNTSINKLKEEKRRLARQRHVASEKFLQHDKQESDAEMATEQEELKKKIRTYVDTLPEKYRSPIWLVLYEGCSYPEVATVLALPEKTVRTQVARGLEKLREIFGSIGSVMSIDMIAALISESKLEVAPITVKQLIDSTELYQSVSSKVVNATSQSSRILIKPSSSLFSLKIILTFLAVSLAMIATVYSLNKIKSTTIKVENVIEKETNQTWDFKAENDRNLPLLLGEWDWSSKLNGMMAPINKPIVLSFPIKPQKKCFSIEFYVMSLATLERSDLIIKLTGYWAKDFQLLSAEAFPQTKKYSIKGNSVEIIKSYYYQNYIFSFVGNQFVGARKYSDDLIGANVVFLCRNFALQKAVSHTFETPPDELIKVIEAISKQKGEIQNGWLINQTTLEFND